MHRLASVQRVCLRWLIFLVCLEIYLRIGGLVSLSVQDYRNRADLKDNDAYRILCIGESTTFVGGKESYPSQLERILNERGSGRTFEVINRGLPGNNSAEIASHLEEDLRVYKPQMVVAMIGINDTEKTPVFRAKAGRRQPYLGDIRILRVLKFVWDHVMDAVDRYQAKFSAATFSPAEDKLRQEIRRHPKNSGAYIELGQYLVEQKHYCPAADLFKQAIRANPKKDFGYQQLADVLILQGDPAGAEHVLVDALKKNRKRAWAYVLLSRFYAEQNKQEARAILEDGLKRMPDNIELYVELISFLRTRHDFDEAQRLLERAMSVNPKQSKLLKEAGFNAAEEHRDERAQQAFEQAARLENSADAFLDLSDWYLRNGDNPRAQAVLIKAVRLYPDEPRLFWGLASLYERDARKEDAAQYRRKGDQLSIQKPLAATQENYRTIVTTVQAHGAHMVCATYAMRKVAPLKKMLNGLEGIVFVDNEEVFSKALAQGKYSDYFSDSFAGDFGHGTAAGNRLLAQTIADVILKDLSRPYAPTP